MPLFEITTRSTFENVYLIEADTVEEAKDRVLYADAIDFYQQHIEEVDTHTIELTGASPTQEDIDIAIENIRNRGYW